MQGTNIVAGTARLYGVTDDDYVIYSSGSTLSAVPIAGGTPVTIYDNTAGTPIDVFVVHDVVIVYSNVTATYVASLSVWSHAIGALKLLSSTANDIAVSPDSAHVVYTTNVNTGGTVGDVYGAATDGSGATPLVTSVVMDSTAAPDCFPYALFDGSYAVVSSCAAGDAGASTPATVSSFDIAGSWAATALVTNAIGGYFTVDSSGHDVVTVGVDPPNAAAISTVSGGTPTTFFGQVGPAPFLYVSRSSGFAVFSEATGGLGYASIADPTAPSPVVSSMLAANDAGLGSAAWVCGVSPDETHVAYAGGLQNLGIEIPSSLTVQGFPTTPGGAAPAPLTVFSGAYVYPGGWTADGSYLFYSTSLQPNGESGSAAGMTGTLSAFNVTTGQSVAITTNPTVSMGVPFTGTRFAYDQNFQVNSKNTNGWNGAGWADLYFADATTASEGTLVQPGVDAWFYVTRDYSNLIYSVTRGGSTDGVYVVPAP
jgi:hypothetical protein